jgi:hypothetical protein
MSCRATLSPRKLLATKISQQRLAQIFVTVRLEIGSREEIEREFPLSDQHIKREREPSKIPLTNTEKP